jgi:SIR2-like domain
MIQTPDNAHYRMLANRILAGAVVPFLGAGVNLCGRPEAAAWQPGQYLPSGPELAAHLATRKGVDYPYDDRTDLLRVSQYVDVMLGNGPLYEWLHEVFDADYAPTPVHRLLASLPSLIRAQPSDGPRFFPLNVTTNYDDLLERAFRDAEEPYDLVTYIADGPDRGRFLHIRADGEEQVIAQPNSYNELRFDERPVIAKIHGAVVRGLYGHDSFVITENHYIDYLSHTDIAKLIPVNIATRMRRSHFLFLGYSLKDWNLRVILHRLWGDTAVGWNSWAVQPHPDGIEERSWYRRGVELLDARLEEYISRLGAELAASTPSTTGEPHHD